MGNEKKPKRRLKKGVKVTAFALAATLTGITLVTTFHHFSSLKVEPIIDEDLNDKNNTIFMTIEEIKNAFDLYCLDHVINDFYIWKNTNDVAYMISNRPISKLDGWQLVDDKECFFREIIDLNYDQMASYWLKEQQLVIKTDDDYNLWQKTDQFREVPETVPNLVFEGDNKYWSITDKKLVVDAQYNIFEFLQVYQNDNNDLFIGFEPNLDEQSNWKYIDSLVNFIEKNQYIILETEKGNTK